MARKSILACLEVGSGLPSTFDNNLQRLSYPGKDQPSTVRVPAPAAFLEERAEESQLQLPSDCSKGILASICTSIAS